MAGSRRARLLVGHLFLVTLCLALLSLPACAADSPTPAATDSGSAEPTARATPGELSMGAPRAVHTATRLFDGRVLLIGGCSTSGCGGVAENAASVLFDPVLRTMQAGPSMAVPRLSHTATLLADGRVLVVGGYGGEGAPPTGSIELFDPSDDSFTAMGSLRAARADHTASLLSDGRVVVAGGRGVDGVALRSVEIIDPVTKTVSDGPDLPEPRTAQVAATLGGVVLLVGGTTVSDTAVASTLQLDLRAMRWVRGPRLARARVKHAAVGLPDGGVLVLGGSGSAESRDAFADTELLRPGGERSRPGPRLPEGRYKLTDAAAALPDGRVAVAGGKNVVVIDTMAGTVRVIGSPSLGTARAFQTLTVLLDGTVLVAGGTTQGLCRRPTCGGCRSSESQSW